MCAMCGRYVSPDEASIERHWHVGREDGNPLAARFNTSPTTQIPILRLNAGGKMKIATARWGLIPGWWKNDTPPTFSFNARLEEAAGKPMWRHPLRHSRCLIPAVGWYEWQAIEGQDPKTGKPRTFKKPHYLHRTDDALFAFAGLLSVWSTPEQDAPLLSCAILTRAAVGPVAEVHDRMPLVLDDAANAEWLDPGLSDPKRLDALIARYAMSEIFGHYTVSTAVNNSRSEDPRLIDRVATT
jgi:putative SOS response-associated peptidase YedK